MTFEPLSFDHKWLVIDAALSGSNTWWRGDKKVCSYMYCFWRDLKAFREFVFFHLFFLFFLNWLHKKASCEPSSLNEKHVAGIQNSGVFQHGPGRHLFLVCTAKSWSRERGCGGNGVGEGGGEEEKRRNRSGRFKGGFFFSWGRCLRGFKGSGGRGVMVILIRLVHCIVWGGTSWPLISSYLLY